MPRTLDLGRRSFAPLAVVAILALAPAQSNAQAPPAAATSSSGSRIGIQGIVVAGLDWPSAHQSFEAAGLNEHPVELGGGVVVSQLWRDLFAQVNATRFSTSGERVFVDDDGTAFPLGIPLDVKATFVDVSVGWKFASTGEGYDNLVSYFGGGAGRVSLRESSPFAQPGDGVDTSATSYHIVGGVEIRLLKWLAASVDLRYRWIPGVLGDAGVSSVVDEKDFGGFHLGAGLRVGFSGRRSSPAPPAETPADTPPKPFAAQEPLRSDNFGTILVAAPIFLKPDAAREPLRTLPAGTQVRVLQEDREWIRIEFADRALGPRVGYVQRQYIRLPQ